MVPMKTKLFVWVLLVFMFALVSCESNTTPGTPDMLTQMFEAQDRATIAAATAQRIANQATTIAQATREFIILQGQQTRIAQDSRATQTVFAGNVNATATTRANNQTRYAEDGRATTYAQNTNATTTAIANQFTATAHAQNMANTATTQANIVQATQVSASATATAQAVIVNATQVSASATSTADAANAQATRTSGNATATVIAANVIAAQEKAEWDRRLESGRAIGTFAFVALVLAGIAIIIGFGALRFIDAGVLRARIFRDKTGTVFVVSERDAQGRQAILIPGRSPGAVLSLTPPQQEPLQIEAGAVDAETTKRDQAVSLLLAASQGKSNADDLLNEIVEGEQIKIVDEPPAQLIAGDKTQMLDGEWKLLSDGQGDK